VSNIRTIGFALLFGIIFGFLMNKANVFVAPTIRTQMIFQRYIMLKMFLGAVGMSMLSVSLLVLCNESIYRKVLNSYIEQNSRRGLFHYLIGGSLIGLGMVVCGSCPGTVFVQVGSGVCNSLLTCVGALLGVLFYYSLLHERISQKQLNRSNIVLRQVSDIFGINQYLVQFIFGFIFFWELQLDLNFLFHGNLI